MREIKFRAWCPVQNKLFESFSLLRAIKESNVSIHDHDVFMQYTGLKDKNGKEIYEGDVVSWGIHKDDRDIVRFNEGRFLLRNYYVSYQDNPNDAFNEGITRLEVIGNIYENPDLID